MAGYIMSSVIYVKRSGEAVGREIQKQDHRCRCLPISLLLQQKMRRCVVTVEWTQVTGVDDSVRRLHLPNPDRAPLPSVSVLFFAMITSSFLD